MSKLLSGPYGSYIHERLTDQGVSDKEREKIIHPAAILGNETTRSLVTRIAGNYLNAGVDVLATHTFGARHLLKDQDLYDQVIAEHLRITRETARNHSKHIEIAASFGPFGDCYKPEQGPKSVAEGVDFWEAALSPLTQKRIGKPDYVLAETVPDIKTAIAFAKVWGKLKDSFRGKITGVLSLIPKAEGGELLDGHPVAEVIKAIVAEVGALPVLLGLNCCPLKAIISTLHAAADASKTSKAQFTFLYPNSSDLNPLDLEQSPASVTSRTAQEAGDGLKQIIEVAEGYLQGGREVVVNECCGGSPGRTEVIAQLVNNPLEKASSVA